MKKEKPFDQLHAELNAWAAWLIRNRVDRSVGWPSSSAIAQWGMKVSGGTSDTLWLPTGEDWTQFDEKVRQLGELWPAKKPDVDNIIKAIGDALNGVLWVDDCQIVRVEALKRYGSADQTRVKVVAMGVG